ncbi:photoreceptor outer segment membrane glycoprotein 2 [Cylas formicarius]|uniref:photoreceptor outer segment membrane glycoprotein 2 n=1 Tax=Cylas formicarius TaxID=197179 RepID=UPI00295866F9|nr:photoreceptor outer segment membrane glycoprotein 2 [Cylas formicarius]
MAIGLFKLTLNQRRTLAAIFLTLNILQILLGAIMTAMSLFVCLSISPKIPSERAEIDFVFLVYGIFGANIMFHWLIGIRICQKCIDQAHKKSTRSLLLLWHCAGTNTVIALIVIAHMSRKTNRHIIKALKNSLHMGMKNYLSESIWKETIDKVQYYLECCGCDSYEDWHKIEWMDKSIVNEKSGLIRDIRLNQETLRLPVVPWSCCKVDFPMQCLHDPIQQVEYTHLWIDQPNLVTDSLNIEGCMAKIKRPIGWIIFSCLGIVFIITFFHIMTIVLSRILYTSCRNAILLYDREGIAPGWIFGRGDLGYTRGKTLTEIMGVTNEILEQRMVSEKQRKKLAKTEHSEQSKAETISPINKPSGQLDKIRKKIVKKNDKISEHSENKDQQEAVLQN